MMPLQYSCIKWILSSRNRYDIEQRLGLDDSHTRPSLELNADHISHAVDVSQLVSLQNDKAFQETVQMHQKSDGTFLWVSLVIGELRRVLKVDMLKVLEDMLSGLTLVLRPNDEACPRASASLSPALSSCSLGSGPRISATSSA
jgi:hypothetical protein